MNLKLYPIYSDSKLPSRAYDTDSGLDLFSYEDIVLKGLSQNTYNLPNFQAPLQLVQHHVLIRTGVAVGIPEGYECQIRPKSGISAKGIIAAFGTIDQTYTGELKVVLYNHTYDDYLISKGEKIAQLVMAPITIPTLEIVSSLEESDRGSNGFGSTGMV